jgi:Arc/MetJ-type ribon-helix-helix transcriptional regulator
MSIRGLQKEQSDEAKLAALREALSKGETSGSSSAFDVKAFLERKHASRSG